MPLLTVSVSFSSSLELGRLFFFSNKMSTRQRAVAALYDFLFCFRLLLLFGYPLSCSFGFSWMLDKSSSSRFRCIYPPLCLLLIYKKKYFFFFFFYFFASSTSKAAAVMNDFEAVAGPVAGRERDPTAFCSGSHLVWNLLSSIKAPASLYIFLLLFLLFILFSLLLLRWAGDVDKCQTIIPRAAAASQQQLGQCQSVPLFPSFFFLFQSLTTTAHR